LIRHNSVRKLFSAGGSALPAAAVQTSKLTTPETFMRARLARRTLQTLIPAAALSIGISVSPVAVAQDYPNKAVRLVNPFAPGAITSIISRMLSQKFQEQTGQPMVVDFKPGAGTNVGGEIVAKADKDGYTLLLGTSSLAINPSLYSKMPYDPIKDLAPIAYVASTPNLLAVNPALPVRTVKELIDYARANPGKLNYASSGNGASNHLGMELFKAMAKVDMVHVPYKGGALASTALLAGTVQVMFSPESTVGKHHEAGKLRIIAVGSPQRIEHLNLPTVSEAGVPGFNTVVWVGLFAPANTPQAIIDRLNRETNTALRDPKTREVFKTAGLTIGGGTPEEMRKTLADDTARMTTVVKASGARVD